MRSIYAVFLRDPRTRRPTWALGTNARQAHQLARETRGELRALDVITYNDGLRTIGAWRAGSFYALSEPIANYAQTTVITVRPRKAAR